ncbi:MAG: hypothetical protein ACLQLH_04745 [Terracidiphilus sp.]
MLQPIIKTVAIVAGAAFLTVLAMMRHAIRTGEDPSEDGPRALIAEFIGLWIGGIFLIWSFTITDKTVQWTLRGVAAVVAIVALGISIRFANMTEIPEKSDKDPTGFENDKTTLHLE